MWIVTGANGFIGSAIVSSLNKSGLDDLVLTDSVGLSERRYLLQDKKFRNFLHTDELFPFLTKVKPRLDGIIHMGACSDTREMDVAFLRRNNTEYTQRLYEFCMPLSHLFMPAVALFTEMARTVLTIRFQATFNR